MQRARQRPAGGDRASAAEHAVAAPALAGGATLAFARVACLDRLLPSFLVMLVIVAAWWGAVVATRSLVFPTPWQVVTGALELLRAGSLFEHIGASLLRVGIGFALAVAIAVPLGL